MLESEIEVLVQSNPALWRDDARIALAPNMREKTLRGALTHYAPVITGEKVLLILDDTLFGSGSKGILLTDRKIYSSQFGDDGSRSQCFDLAAVRTAHVRDGNSLWMNGRLFFKMKLHPETLHLLRNLLALIRDLFLWEDVQKKGYTRRPEAASADAFSENQSVPCQLCGRTVKVAFKEPGKIVLAASNEMAAIALRCQDCGAILCYRCAHPRVEIITECPLCHKETGLYFFMKSSERKKFDEFWTMEHDQYKSLIDRAGRSVLTVEQYALELLKLLPEHEQISWTSAEQAFREKYAMDEETFHKFLADGVNAGFPLAKPKFLKLAERAIV